MEPLECGVLLGSLVVLLGACSNSASAVTTTTAVPTTSTSVLTAPGTIFVAKGGHAGASVGVQGGTGFGSVTAYRPGATGNARPIIVITAGIVDPVALTFDSSGDLWVASNGDVVEYS